MKLNILAGGRGQRMGTLTNAKQKATLSFMGSTLLEWAINGFVEDSRISTIHVLTGYRGEDVHKTLLIKYSKELEARRISYIDCPSIKGTLSRLQASIEKIGVTEDCIVCGIDSFVPVIVLRNFLDFCSRSCQNFSLVLSTHLRIAPTHKVASLHKGLVCEYGCANEIGSHKTGKYLTDVGIRFFPAENLKKITTSYYENNSYIPTYIQSMLRKGADIRGFVFNEDWNHFAFAEDLVVSGPP